MSLFYLFPMSEKSESALHESRTKLLNSLEAGEIDLKDIWLSAIRENKDANFRNFVIAQNPEELKYSLLNHDKDFYLENTRQTPEIVFVFHGMGEQYLKMGEDLYKSNAFFKQTFEQCINILNPYYNFDLIDFLYVGGSEELLKTPVVTHPLLFVVEYCLAKLLMRSGVKPRALIGHSLGEYVAATVAGVFRLEDALRIVYQRARLIQDFPKGAMLAVMLPEDEIKKYLTSKLSIAAINAPTFLTISGSEEEIKNLTQRLLADSLASLPLSTTHAFHTRELMSLKAEFLGIFTNVKLSEPGIPLISNLSGTWVRSNEVTTPEYWLRHMCNSVRFYNGIEELGKNPGSLFVEIGPGESLTSFISQTLLFAGVQVKKTVILSVLKKKGKEINDIKYLLTSLGRLWINGVKIKWQEICGNSQA